MAIKKTFSMPDECADLFDQVKELATEFDETISSVFVDAMKRYVEDRSEQLQGVEEFIVWEGSKIDKFEASGKYVRFFAKEVAKGGGEQAQGHYYWEVLYYTKKKKYLVVRTDYDGTEEITKIEYANTLAELAQKGLLPEVVNQLRSSRDAAEFLDV